jgi:hypothetical protein
VVQWGAAAGLLAARRHLLVPRRQAWLAGLATPRRLVNNHQQPCQVLKSVRFALSWIDQAILGM